MAIVFLALLIYRVSNSKTGLGRICRFGIHFNCATCGRLSQLERDVFESVGVQCQDVCLCRGGPWLTGEGDRGETRRGRDRNEWFMPRSKNKQFLTRKQQWNPRRALDCVSFGGGHFLGSLFVLLCLGFHSTEVSSSQHVF